MAKQILHMENVPTEALLKVIDAGLAVKAAKAVESAKDETPVKVSA